MIYMNIINNNIKLVMILNHQIKNILKSKNVYK